MKFQNKFFLSFLLTCLLVVQQKVLSEDNENPIENINHYIVELIEPSVLEAFPSQKSSFTPSIESIHTLYKSRYQYALQQKNKQSSIEKDLANLLSLDQQEFSQRITFRYFLTSHGFAIQLTSHEAEILKRSSLVKTIITDNQVHPLLDQAAAFIGATNVWNINAQGIKCSGADCITGKGVTIGIIDSGIDKSHSDFPAGKILGGFNFLAQNNDLTDRTGHGSHVSSIAAGNGVLKGIAPDAIIVPYKVFDISGGSNESIIRMAIERAVDPNDNLDTSDHLDVINLSLGQKGDPHDLLSSVVDHAVEADVIVVVSAGNSGPTGDILCRTNQFPDGSRGSICSPGTAKLAITVGASDGTQVAKFSSRGHVLFQGEEIKKPDVVAPGNLICAVKSTTANDTLIPCKDEAHTRKSGTSMAAPMVVGIAALLKQKNPLITPAEVKETIIRTSANLGLPSEEQGYGLVNALRAVTGIEKSQSFPLINQGGIVGAADFGPTVSPGGLASIFGINFSGTNSVCQADTLPLPTELCGTSIYVSGKQVPLLFVSPGQINFQVPFEISTGSFSYNPVTVRVNGNPSNTALLPIEIAAPAIFGFTSEDEVLALAQHLDYKLVTRANPARRGEAIIVYMTGFGAGMPAVSTGAAAPSDPLSVFAKPTVRYGGSLAQVLFGGKAPGLVGVDQINFVVPMTAISGSFLLQAQNSPKIVALPIPFSSIPLASKDRKMQRSISKKKILLRMAKRNRVIRQRLRKFGLL